MLQDSCRNRGQEVTKSDNHFRFWIQKGCFYYFISLKLKKVFLFNLLFIISWPQYQFVFMGLFTTKSLNRKLIVIEKHTRWARTVPMILRLPLPIEIFWGGRRKWTFKTSQCSMPSITATDTPVGIIQKCVRCLSVPMGFHSPLDLCSI